MPPPLPPITLTSTVLAPTGTTTLCAAAPMYRNVSVNGAGGAATAAEAPTGTDTTTAAVTSAPAAASAPNLGTPLDLGTFMATLEETRITHSSRRNANSWHMPARCGVAESDAPFPRARRIPGKRRFAH